jgi:hypothetical protein
MHAGNQDALRQFGFGRDRRRKERRIEHLKRHVGAGDAYPGQFPNLAFSPATRHNAEAFSQIVGHGLKVHSVQYRATRTFSRLSRRARFWYPRKVDFITT